MKEFEKLEEAKYFFDKMIEAKSDNVQFTHNLSAFLSASRSPRQFIDDRLKNKNNPNIDGQKWYNKLVASSKIIKYFRDKRNANIHAERVKPNINIKSTFVFTVKARITTVSQDANEENISLHESAKPSGNSENQSISEVLYKFDDWEGEEDVLSLCEQYLLKIEEIINEAVKFKYLS